jgi:transforming growth factor-beta-induced protein
MLLSRRELFGITLAGLLCTLSSSVQASEKKDIVDTAIATGQFKTLAAALQAADLVDSLKGKGPFTVFAPTDEAFGKLPKGTVEDLLKPD